MEVCDCSGCVQGLRILLDAEGILTLPIFMLSDGSLAKNVECFFCSVV